MRINDLMWFSIIIMLSLISVYLMNSEVTGYSAALGFKGTGLAALKPIDWEVNAEGQFKVTLQNLFEERIVIKFVTIMLNDTHAAGSFDEVMTQEEVKEFVVNGLEVTENEVYNARIKVYYEERSGYTLIDQGLLLGVVI